MPNEAKSKTGEEEKFSADPWLNFMMAGRFAEAWKISDDFFKSCAGACCQHLPRHQQYIWDGSSLQDKTVLVRCYHGLGDTIQFIRYVPDLKKIAKKVIVWAQAPLIPLLQTLKGIDQILPLHDGTPEVDYDVDVEVMELPYIFRTELATIPRQIPYLQVASTKPACGPKTVAVGLVWKAGDWDPQRNISFSHLLPLFEVPGTTICILQGGAIAAGWLEGTGWYPGELNLHDYARLIAGMDLLISIDSMPAHLAGALGIPVWTLLHAGADWRWMRHREETPWYPTMRLFRQEEQGLWQPVVERVRAELYLFVKARKGADGWLVP